MLSVSLAQILVQHNTMHYSQATVHTIHQQENQPCNILGLDNNISQQEKHNERYTDRTHVAGKTLRLTLRTEVKDAKHQRRQ